MQTRSFDSTSNETASLWRDYSLSTNSQARVRGVDLTFAAHLAAGSQSECQIQNSTRHLYLLVSLILTFAKSPTELGNVRIGPLVRREAIKQAIAPGAPEVGLRAAAVRAAREMRTIPGLRGVVIPQPYAIEMPYHRRSLRAARPILASAVVAGGESSTVRLRSG